MTGKSTSYYIHFICCREGSRGSSYAEAALLLGLGEDGAHRPGNPFADVMNGDDILDMANHLFVNVCYPDRWLKDVSTPLLTL